VKLKNSPAELVRHEAHIRTRIVQPICDKLSSSHPALAVSNVYLNGSTSNQTKIDTPNELDYVLPMVHSDHVQMKQHCDIDWEVIDCRIHPSQHQRLSQYPGLLDSKGFLEPYSFIQKYLPQIVNESLLELHSEGSLVYKGKIALEEEPIESSKLKYNEVQLDKERHVTSLCLRVGGLLCATDIDLCFCLKKLELPYTNSRFKFYIAVAK
ncbi:unnamed protein product, partial [Owenia fusiformis]